MNHKLILISAYGLFILFLSFNSNANEAIKPVDPEFLAFFAAIYNDPVERAELRLDDFAERLVITQDQQTHWRAFKQFFLAQFEQRQSRMEDFRLAIEERNGQPLTTPESLVLKLQSLEQEINDVRKAQVIISQLYLTLDKTQKAIFDQGMRALWFKTKMRQRRIN